MLKLIRLEWKKNNIVKYICGAAVLTLFLCLFLFAHVFLGIAEEPDGTLDVVEGMNTISSLVELFTSISYLIFTSVMLASFLVSPYKNKTMSLMFSYPIKRQKILAAQMAAVWLFNFLALLLTKLLIYACISAGAGTMRSPFVMDFDMGSLPFYVSLLTKAAVIVSMSFIALFVGLAVKSSKATIITSFLLIFLTQANVGDFSLAGNTAVSVILTAVSFVFAGLSVCHVETRDLR